MSGGSISNICSLCSSVFSYGPSKPSLKSHSLLLLLPNRILQICRLSTAFREFPEIRADFFRPLKNRPPALAYFLSHIHSDHLTGLETFKSPFVYCSHATKEMLLRLKKYPSRLNYAKGILENPHTQTYKHLAKVLKPIPLDTPTTLELGPGRNIQVTLLDANHCVVFEGDGRAVLYTGDIRCEPLFVSNIARNPSIIEYLSRLKIIDRIYLDTSMLENVNVQTKEDGLAELLRKVAKYPSDTIFHFHAWTFGYEDIWIALSKVLKSKIHVDKYKFDIYKSLTTKPTDQRFASQTHLAKEAPYLAGFTCGNSQHAGCLTLEENVRIHSCEKGMGCSVTENKPIVWIKPIVAHLKNGQDMVEVGIGGGGGDLTEKVSLAAEDIIELLPLIAASETVPEDRRKDMLLILKKALLRDQDLSLDMDIATPSDEATVGDIIKALAKKVESMRNRVSNPEEQTEDRKSLPNVIRFPWARHSFLPELRHFVATFKPKDVWPNTVDISWIERGLTIRRLFGDCCSGDLFEHDQLIERMVKAQSSLLGGKHEEDDTDSQQTNATSTPTLTSPIVPSIGSSKTISGGRKVGDNVSPVPLPLSTDMPQIPPPGSSGQRKKRNYDSFKADSNKNAKVVQDDDDVSTASDTEDDSQASALSVQAYETRQRAFRAACSNARGESGAWAAIGLISTTDHHSFVEEELGSKEEGT
ncbi:beta-lactamase-like protein [Biscogniauxia marginata]|nr:beta-lactamase-like protein [Biscogniauxia marginata]